MMIKLGSIKYFRHHLINQLFIDALSFFCGVVVISTDALWGNKTINSSSINLFCRAI